MTVAEPNVQDNEITNPGMGPNKDGGADAQFLKLKRWFITARDHSNDWRKWAEEDYAFVAGDQWSEEDKDTLKSQLRPVISFNRCGVIADSVSGQEIQNRQEVRYLPRQMGDVGVNELYTAAGKWFRDQSYAEDEESDAFLDMVICGMGWIETRIEYETDPEGKSVDDRVDPLEMYWDPSSKKRNLDDRRFQFRARKMPLEDALDLFPEYCDYPELLHAAWADNHPDGKDPHNATEAKFYRNDQSGRDAGDPTQKVMIVHAQWFDREPCYRMQDPATQKIVSMSQGKYRMLSLQMQKLGMQPPQAVKGIGRVYREAFIGAEILKPKGPDSAEDGVDPCRYPDGFTINPMTGKRDRNNNIFYGLVRPMKDPQRWANKFFSSLIHQFSTSGKGVVIQTDAVVSVRDFEEQWARADGIKWVKPGMNMADKILQLQGAQMNQGVSQMMEYAISSMRDVTGVNMEILGQQQQDQAGVLEYQRKMAGMTILATFFDALRRFRKKQGHILLFYIRTYFSDGRLIRIDGQEGQKYIPLVRDPTQEIYDVIVDDAPTSPNQKEHTWLLITQLMPVLRGLSDPTVWAELLKYSPLPSSLTEKLAQYAMQKAQQPPQPSPTDQAKIAQSQSATARNIAGAIKDLSSSGIQGPGPGEDIAKQAVAALLDSGQSAQDHGEATQQNAQQHQQAMVQAEQAHQHALQQNAQQAVLTPPQGP